MSVAGAIPGYHSRYLRVDLTSRRATVVPIPADVLRQFLGGSGLSMARCEVDDPGLDLDLDEPADYERALALANDQ